MKLSIRRNRASPSSHIVMLMRFQARIKYPADLRLLLEETSDLIALSFCWRMRRWSVFIPRNNR